jgi:hypothetical protein
MHPIIGVWTAEAKYEGRFRIDRMTTSFHADGAASIVTPEGPHDGIWVPSGDHGAKLYVVFPVPQGEGFGGWFSVRGTVDISPDGTAYTMAAVFKRPRPDGGVVETQSTLTGTSLTIDSNL